MSRQIKISDDTHKLLSEEKGDSTFDGAIRRLLLGKELLPTNARLGLENLTTHAERGVFLAGMLYTATCQHKKDFQEQTHLLVENMNTKNFMKLYSLITMEMAEVFERKEELNKLSEMASYELLKGDIESMNEDDMKFAFTLGQTLPRNE